LFFPAAMMGIWINHELGLDAQSFKRLIL
jgi:hypothetical protein